MTDDLITPAMSRQIAHAEAELRASIPPRTPRVEVKAAVWSLCTGSWTARRHDTQCAAAFVETVNRLLIEGTPAAAVKAAVWNMREGG